jgi:hypothetical protein
MSGLNLFLNATERLYPRMTRGLAADQARELKHIFWTHLDPSEYLEHEDDDTDDSNDPFTLYASGTYRENRRNLWNAIRASDDDISPIVLNRIRDILTVRDSDYYTLGEWLIRAYQRFYLRATSAEMFSVDSWEAGSDHAHSDNSSNDSNDSDTEW